MRWLLYLLIFLALLVLAGFLFPREIAAERSVYISKPPEAVFPYVNNFRLFNSWSPWAELDPDMQYNYSGPQEGMGASMSWSSADDKVGSGSQTISQSVPFSLVRTDLDFGDSGEASAEFRLQPQGSGTNVTWSFSSDMGGSPINRWMGLLVKRMVGDSYQKGLNKLKITVESAETPLPATDGDVDAETEQPADGDEAINADPGDLDTDMENEILEEEPEEPVEEE